MTKAKLSIDRLARLLGILVGVAVAVVAVISWRVPGGERTLGTDVRIEALQTGVPLALRLRALPSVRDLDGLLVVRVSAGSRTLYDGSLGGLRAAGTRPLALRGATAQRLHVSASLPAGVRSGFQGRIVDVSLQIATQRVR